MLRPCDDCYVIDNKDPTACIAAAVARLTAAGTTSFVYGRGDDWLQFPGRQWLEANQVAITFFTYTKAGGGGGSGRGKGGSTALQSPRYLYPSLYQSTYALTTPCSLILRHVGCPVQ
jgi:hypothetical protein